MQSEPEKDLLTRAEAGDPEAQSAIGRFYAQRALDRDSVALARDWFHRAANQGFAPAKYNLGVLSLREGRQDAAMPWFEEAAADGWLPALFALGQLSEETGETTKAVAYYERAASRGLADAQDALGRLSFALETEPGYEAAHYWSTLAAEQGQPASQTRLGTIYHEGLGVKRDPRRAAAYFLAAAKAGHPGAQLMIGVALDLGIGVDRDRVEAAHFLLRSVAQGNEMAKAYLQKLLTELEPAEKAALESLLDGSRGGHPV